MNEFCKFCERFVLLALFAIGIIAAVQMVEPARAQAEERTNFIGPDTDGDSLRDFHEVHKYRSDPTNPSTAGSQVPDGDWQQRREFNYSVRVILRVMPPYNIEALQDDYQDVRVLQETEDFVELEVILYTHNSNAESIVGNPNWQRDYADMSEYLSPGVTTNWDGTMRSALLRELAADGIHPDNLTDKEVVEQVSRWLFRTSHHRSMFCTFYVTFPNGKPAVLSGAEKSFQRDKGDPTWTVAQQFEHELFGKEMFARRTHGTCTSTAVYQTTVLRALGIPTRMIICVPPADASDPNQIKLLEQGLTHRQVQVDALLAALGAGNSFSNHTFCEVFVGGRWRRLNYTALGQNVLERNYLGLMIKTHTFNDLSEAKLAETWGNRYARGLRDEVFSHSNPYRLMAISDHFGKHADVPNPPVEKELKEVTVSRAYWPDSPKAAPEVREMRSGASDDGARFFIHCDEWLEDAGGYLQYKLFMRQADGNFLLRCAGQPDVACRLSKSSYTHRSRNLCELEMVIPPAEYAKMLPGKAYQLQPVKNQPEYHWSVRTDVTLTK